MFTKIEKLHKNGHKNVTNGRKRSAMVNGQDSLGTNSGKRSRSRFKNKRNTVSNLKDQLY
jgi:hypothetical protein